MIKTSPIHATPLLICDQFAIEHGRRNSWIGHSTWWFSITNCEFTRNWKINHVCLPWDMYQQPKPCWSSPKYTRTWRVLIQQSKRWTNRKWPSHIKSPKTMEISLWWSGWPWEYKARHIAILINVHVFLYISHSTMHHIPNINSRYHFPIHVNDIIFPMYSMT